MKGLYSWRLAGLSSFHFLVSRRLLALRFLPFAILLWTLPMHAGGVVTNCTEANLRNALAGGGTVTFACDGTITLAAELVITNNTVVDATGHTISLSGNNSVRIFAVTNGATLSLVNLTLRDGRAQYGGAINNVNGRVELLHCTLDGNVAVAGTNGIARGGAIWNSGSLTSRLVVANSVFSRNKVEGGISRGGGAISCGLYVPLGGGGYRYDYGDSTVVNSTFVGNDVSGSNSAAGAAVEMIAGVLTAANCTFSDNRGPSTVYSQGAGLGSYRSCIFARTIGGANIVGPFGDSGFNISDDSPWINGLGSQYNPNLKLGGLADNGGPTKTVALLEGSPAIDAGADSGCPPTDQRGFARPVGAHCDIGAYEGSLPVPDFMQSFSPAGIVEGGVARLDFTLQNTSSVSYASVSFTNVLPPQVRIAAVPAISNACGNGTIIAPPGGGTIVFHGGTLGGNQTCNIGVSVVSSVHGVWTNPPVALWSDKTGQGRSNTAAALSVTGGPVVTTSQVSNFSSNSVSLRATIDPAGLATSVFFQYGNTASFGSATTPVSVGGGYAEALALTELGGLISDTTYYCQAVASNAVGVAYGSILSFTTFGAPLTSSWFDQAGLLAVLGTTNVVMFSRDGTITMTNTLTIEHDTTLDGTGHNVVLSGGNAVRVFQVNPGVRLTLANLTIADGRHTGTNTTNFMGTAGAGFGGGIYHQGDLTLLNCVMSNNVAVGGDGLNYGAPAGTGMGGAIFNEGGLLLVTNCLFVQNGAIGGMARYNSFAYPNPPVASGDGFGGGIFSRNGLAYIARSRFLTNSASSGAPVPWGVPSSVGPWGSASGGALHLDGGSMDLEACLLAENSAMRIPAFGRFTYGSGVYTGGAITVSNGTLRCWRTTFATNRVDVPNGFSGGGAVFDRGETRLVDCVLAGNRALGVYLGDSGTDSRGGGIYSVSPLVISGCVFAGNLALGGGNITLLGLGSHGSGVGSHAFGGAIFQQSDLRMTNTTLFANEARGGDGVVLNYTNFGLAGLARGAGLFNAGGTVQLVNVTFSSNAVFLGAGNPPTNNVAPVQGGGIFSTNGAVTLWNSIVANSGSGSNCFGTLIDGGHNISSDGSCKFAAPGSLNNTDPLLGTLGDYGGPTPTVPLLIGSPALDAADSAHCPLTDQRGVARPFGAACDIGAFESQLIVVAACAESDLSNALAGGGRVTFACDGTITLTNTLTIDHDTTLDGSGRNVVLSGGNAARVFQVNPGVRLTLINLTIANGRHVGTNGAPPESAFGGAIYSNGGTVNLLDCTLINNSAKGGDASYFTGGAARGGAIFNEGGTLNITNTLLSGNSTIGGTGASLGIGPNYFPAGDAFGGAIFNRTGRVNVAGSAFSLNTATGGVPGLGNLYFGPGSGFGGAVHSIGGELVVTNCAFSDNSAIGGSVPQAISMPSGSGGAGNGGALSVSNGLLICIRSAFTANQAVGGSGRWYGGRGGDSQGGAIHNLGSAAFRDCTFSDNVSLGGGGGPIQSGDGKGGAVYSGGTLEISTSTLVGNRAVPTIINSTAHGGGGGAGNGGGIFNTGILTATNVTLLSNLAEGGSVLLTGGVGGAGTGGGLFNATGAVQLVHVTISENSAVSGEGLLGNDAPPRGGNIHSTNGTVTLWNSIVANSPSGSNCFGSLIDGGRNLSSDGSCNFSAPGSLNNTDPLLGALGDYGGPTPTVPLREGSPALNAANALYCPPTDQRGFTRPYGAGCDVGAFEWTPYLPNAFVLEPMGPGITRLVFAGTPNETYQLLVSTNLPVWSLLTTFTPDPSGLFRYVATNDDTRTCLFFKAAKP